MCTHAARGTLLVGALTPLACPCPALEPWCALCVRLQAAEEEADGADAGDDRDQVRPC